MVSQSLLCTRLESHNFKLRATSWRESSLFPDQFSQTKNGLGTRLEGEGVAHFRSGPCSVGIESLQSESSACFFSLEGKLPQKKSDTMNHSACRSLINGHSTYLLHVSFLQGLSKNSMRAGGHYHFAIIISD